MNHELLGGICIAGGFALYTVKEIIRFIVDANLNRKQANLINIYPIYSDVYNDENVYWIICNTYTSTRNIKI